MIYYRNFYIKHTEMNYLLFAFLSLFIENKYCYDKTKFVKIYNSSIFCTGKNASERYCFIKHLYYLPALDNYFILQGEGSELHGLLKGDFNKFVETSSIHSHSFHTFSFEKVNVTQSNKEILTNVNVIREPTIIFSRFYPLNLMHTFHDDLIPLYQTFRILNCVFSKLNKIIDDFKSLNSTNADLLEKFLDDLVKILNLAVAEKMFLIHTIKRSLLNDLSQKNIRETTLILLIYFMQYLSNKILSNKDNVFNHCSKIELDSFNDGLLLFADNYGYNFHNLFSIFSKNRPILQHYLKCTDYYNNLKSAGYNFNIQNFFSLNKDDMVINELNKQFSDSSKKNWPKDDILHSSSNCMPIRFENIFVGISRSSGWYQYGFKEPQCSLKGIQIDGEVIRNFTSYIKTKIVMGADHTKDSNGLNLNSSYESVNADYGNNNLNYEILLENDYTTKNNNKYNVMNIKKKDSEPKLIIILSRKQNRLILNELQLVLNLSLTLRAVVKVVAMETHNLSEVIELVSQADVIIGVHGSMLIMLMFLPKFSLIIELFPFGINPTYYTPYKTLSNLQNMNIYYASWRCMHKNCSQAYEDRPPYLGGIKHLNALAQNNIRSSQEVPQHLCCSDPHWLHRIYQDVSVDIGEILGAIKCWQKLDNKEILSEICNRGNVKLHYKL